jgi:hypothetical protein
MENSQINEKLYETDEITNSDSESSYDNNSYYYPENTENKDNINIHNKFFEIKEELYNFQKYSCNYNMMSLYKDKYKLFTERYNIEITNKLFNHFINKNDFTINKNYIHLIDFTTFKVTEVLIFKGIKYPGIDITIYLTNDEEHILDINACMINNNDNICKTITTIEYDMKDISQYYNFDEYIHWVFESIEIVI